MCGTISGRNTKSDLKIPACTEKTECQWVRRAGSARWHNKSSTKISEDEDRHIVRWNVCALIQQIVNISQHIWTGSSQPQVRQQTHTCTRKKMRIHTHTHAHTFTHTPTLKHTHGRMHTQAHTHTQTQADPHTQHKEGMDACTNVCEEDQFSIPSNKYTRKLTHIILHIATQKERDWIEHVNIRVEKCLQTLRSIFARTHRNATLSIQKTRTHARVCTCRRTCRDSSAFATHDTLNSKAVRHCKG